MLQGQRLGSTLTRHALQVELHSLRLLGGIDDLDDDFDYDDFDDDDFGDDDFDDDDFDDDDTDNDSGFITDQKPSAAPRTSRK